MRPLEHVVNRRVMIKMLVAVGHHGSATVPPLLADDVHCLCCKGIRGPHDGADIVIRREILNRNVEREPARV